MGKGEEVRVENRRNFKIVNKAIAIIRMSEWWLSIVIQRASS